MPQTIPGVPAGHRSGYVAIVGQPNVGKSTLLNKLLDFKVAIVTSKPQTTRNRVVGIRTDEQSQVIFVDTPGIHQSDKELNKLLLDTARRACADVDLILYLVDAQQKDWNDAERFTLETIRTAKAPRLFVPNKIDLIEKVQLLPLIERFSKELPFEAHIPISAETGDGIDRLMAEIVQRLPEGPRYYPEDQVSDMTERDIAAEIIREKIFLETSQEVPYSSAVFVEQFEEVPERRLSRIHATIVVERPSQKGILIGKGGSMLRRIGESSRLEIERLLGTKVFLELFVRVEPNWTRDSRKLRKLGLLEK
ncbi:MAG: GTPase Era [Myxococcota bacterium]